MAGENDIGGKVGLDITDFKANIAELNRQIKVIDSGFKAAAAGMDDWSKSEEGLQNRIDSLNKIVDLQKQKVAGLTEQYQKVAAEQGSSSKAAQNLEARINRETASLNSNQKQVDDLTTDLKNFNKEKIQAVLKSEEMRKAQKKLAGAYDVVKKAAIGAVAAVAGGVVASVKAAIDYESAFAGVRKTVDATEEEYANLSDGIRNMSKEIPIAATEIASIAESAGQLGIQKENILGFTRVMADLGNATNLSGDQAASTFAKFANITQMSQNDFDKLGSSIVALGNNMATTEADIAAMSLRLAAQGKQVGLSESEVLGLSATMSSLGIEAEAGGTAMTTVLKKINNAVGAGGDELKSFAAAAGLSSEEFASKWKSDPITALQAFISGLGQSGAAGENLTTILNELGIKGIRESDTILRMAGNADLLSKAVGISSDAWEENTALANEAEQRYGTTASQFKILKNTVTDLAVDIGQKFLPVVKQIVERLKDVDTQPIVDGFQWLLDHASAIAAGAAAIGAAFVTWKVVTTVQAVVGAVKAWQTATQGMTAAQAALNLVMALNPIGLIITAVAALVAGLIVLWNTNEGFRNALIGAWDAITNAFKAVFNWVKDNWPTLLLMLINPIAGALKLLYDMNPQFKAWVDNIFSAIVDTIKSLPGIVLGFFTDLYNGILQWGSNAWNWAKKQIPKIIDDIIGFFNELPGKIGYALGYAIGTLIKWGIDAVKWAIEEVPKIIAAVIKFFAELPGKIAKQLLNAIDEIKRWGTNVGLWIAAEVPKLINKIVDFFAAIPGKVANIFNLVIDKLKGWITSTISTVKTEVPKIIDKIVQFFEELPGKMVEIGKSIVTGLWSGITNTAGWLKDKVSDFAGGLVGGIKDALGIHSPSAVMRDEVGKMIGAGMAEGIADSARQVNAAMQDINSNVLSPSAFRLGNTKQATSSNETTNHYHFEGLLDGANIVVRSDSDIKGIARELYELTLGRNQGLGVATE